MARQFSNTWLGEGMWIDDHATVALGSNVCVSQGAYLFTGNHDRDDPRFRFFCKPATIEDGGRTGVVWSGVAEAQGICTAMPARGQSGEALGMSRLANAPRYLLRRILPAPARQMLRRLLERKPLVGRVNFGDLRRLTPIDAYFGFGRGLPVDRYYIEAFLAEHADDICGRVLEIGDPSYTVRFGGARVTRSDVLHVQPGHPLATFVGDLTKADHIPSGIFDCIILTQTLHLIYDVRAAARTLHRILKPGGVVLATVPGISQIDPGEWHDTWYWSFTARSAARLFDDAFPGSDVRVEVKGNVLAAISFLHGLAADELTRRELDHRDPTYPVIITIRARKAATA